MHNILLMGGVYDGRIQAVQQLPDTITFYGQHKVEHHYHRMGAFGNFTVYQSEDYRLNFADQLVGAYAENRQHSKANQEPLSIRPCDTFAAVIKIIGEHTQLRTHLITTETDFISMQLDSLDKVEVIMHIEDHFDVEITDAKAENIKTVGDIVAAIKRES